MTPLKLMAKLIRHAWANDKHVAFWLQGGGEFRYVGVTDNQTLSYLREHKEEVKRLVTEATITARELIAIFPDSEYCWDHVGKLLGAGCRSGGDTSCRNFLVAGAVRELLGQRTAGTNTHEHTS